MYKSLIKIFVFPHLFCFSLYPVLVVIGGRARIKSQVQILRLRFLLPRKY